MNKNDIERLKEVTNIEDVVDALGLERKSSGIYTYIRCPHHDDAHMTNCCYRANQNFVYCFACNKKTTAVDLIMKTTGCSYGDACDKLWEINGRPDWYYAKKTDNKSHEFYIMPSEMRLIDLKFKSRIELPIDESSKKEFLNAELPHYVNYSTNTLNYLLLRTRSGLEWKDFYKEKQIRSIVLKKVEVKRNQIKEMIKLLPGLADTEYVKKVLKTLSSLEKRARSCERKASRAN